MTDSAILLAQHYMVDGGGEERYKFVMESGTVHYIHSFSFIDTAKAAHTLYACLLKDVEGDGKFNRLSPKKGNTILIDTTKVESVELI